MLRNIRCIKCGNDKFQGHVFGDTCTKCKTKRN